MVLLSHCTCGLSKTMYPAKKIATLNPVVSRNVVSRNVVSRNVVSRKS